MNGNDLLNIIGKIDPSYIEVADAPVQAKRPILKWVAIAACLALVLAGTYFVLQNTPQSVQPVIQQPTIQQSDVQHPNTLPDLPALTLYQDVGSMGSFGHLGKDISDVVIDNPWRASMQLETLPVWKNTVSFDKLEKYNSGVDRNAMYALLWDVAGRLGKGKDDVVILQDVPAGENIYPLPGPEAQLKAEVSGFEITVSPELLVSLQYVEPKAIPQEYRLSATATYEEAYALAQYLLEEYRHLLSMKDPQIDVDRNCNVSGEFCYEIAFYEGASEDADKLVNYKFNRVEFPYNSYDQHIHVIYFRQAHSGQFLADYPIISVQEATDMLVNGQHVQNPYVFPGIEYVKEIELVYRAGTDAYYMPYYCFYVHIPDVSIGNGLLQEYAGFYVPAVHPKYIQELTVWDGYIN